MFTAAFVTGVTLALSGTVVDRLGAPVEGAEACLIAGGQATLCVPTDANGFWRLPDSAADSIRVTKSGYLAGSAAAVTQSAPIVLERGSSLRARVVDPAGKPIDSGTITLIYSSGKKVGPFPFNRAGLLHPSLPPGAVRVTAEAEGWTLRVPVTATLEPGGEHEVVLRMTRP